MTDTISRMIDRVGLHKWQSVAVIFFIGLMLRSVVFMGAHGEGDEKIYMTLVEQLETGKGYTLQGSQLLDSGLLDREGYDRPLFFHPPGGIMLYWLLFKLFAHWGFPLVQVFSFVLFFWSMLLLARSLGISSGIGFVIVAALAAFSPIMMHVTTKFWLDAPLLAFTTLAAALCSRGAASGRNIPVFAAGLVLGYASLIKLTAFIVLPALCCMVWPLLKQPDTGRYFRFLLLLVLPALLVQLPWELYQWQVVGSPFPGWAGKPSEALIASNPYIYQVTVAHSPWIYFSLTPLVLWTITPALLFFVMYVRSSGWMVRASLLLWIFTVIFFHIALGFIGYSKVTRYVVLITPAVILLFASGFNEAVGRLRMKNGRMDMRLIGVLSLAVVALLLEILTGIFAAAAFDKVLP